MATLRTASHLKTSSFAVVRLAMGDGERIAGQRFIEVGVSGPAVAAADAVIDRRLGPRYLGGCRASIENPRTAAGLGHRFAAFHEISLRPAGAWAHRTGRDTTGTTGSGWSSRLGRRRGARRAPASCPYPCHLHRATHTWHTGRQSSPASPAWSSCARRTSFDTTALLVCCPSFPAFRRLCLSFLLAEGAEIASTIHMTTNALWTQRSLGFGLSLCHELECRLDHIVAASADPSGDQVDDVAQSIAADLRTEMDRVEITSRHDPVERPRRYG